MCRNLLVLNVFSVINTLVLIAKIFVPLIIIITTTIDFFKTASSNNPDISPVIKKVGTRLLAAIIIFLLPTIVNVVFGLVETKSDINGLSCLTNITEENKNLAKYLAIENSLKKALENNSYESYHRAKYYIDSLSTSKEKNAYTKRLVNLKIKLDEHTESVNKKRAEEIKKYNNLDLGNNSSSGSGVHLPNGAKGTPNLDGSKGAALFKYGLQFLGNQYLWGGEWNGELPYTPTDCSGFIQGLYRHFGISISRSSAEQRNDGKLVTNNHDDIERLSKIGDIICFEGHVGLYDGNGYMLEAKGKAYGITYDRKAVDHKNFVAVRRIFDE